MRARRLPLAQLRLQTPLRSAVPAHLRLSLPRVAPRASRSPMRLRRPFVPTWARRTTDRGERQHGRARHPPPLDRVLRSALDKQAAGGRLTPAAFFSVNAKKKRGEKTPPLF